MRTIALAAVIACTAPAPSARAECVAIPNPYVAGWNTLCAPGMRVYNGVPFTPHRVNAPSELEQLEQPLVSTPLQDTPIGQR